MAESHDRLRSNNNIPVFTVIKNNAILKNIFLLAPPEMRNLDGDDDDAPLEEKENILTVGRHPSCSVVLSHPSISRFHLQIRSKPNLGKLSVTDMSSVHGTWVCGKRIKPRDCVELNEGDEMRLGGSSRVYKLHWVSACQAYYLDNPFCPASDVVMCDDIERRKEESFFQDETGSMTTEDVSLNLEAKTSFVPCEEVPLQRPVRNDTVLKGILKHTKESSLCEVKPLSFPLPDVETMKVAEGGDIDVEKQFMNAPVSEFSSGRGIECSQMVERDELVPLNQNLSEDHKQMKQLCSVPESCTDETVCIIASQESPGVMMSEKQFLLAKDQPKMPIDNTKGLYGNNDEDCYLLETERGINKSVSASQTPKLDLTVEKLLTAENGERFDSVIMDICEYSYVKNEAPKPQLTGELFATENGKGFDAMLMDAREYLEVEIEAPKSTPIDVEAAINPESSDETQHSKFERACSEFVFDQGSIHREGDVKPEDIIQLSEIDSRSLQLVVNSTVRLGTVEKNVAIESVDTALVSDSGIQIREPLLDSFVFSENDTRESHGFMCMNSESESQSPKTPLCAKSILDNGNEKVSGKVSDQRSNMSKVSLQRCEPLGALKIVLCSSKVKRRGSTTNARTQLRNSNADEKPVLKTQFEHEEDKNEICTSDKENCEYDARPLKCMKKRGILDHFEFSSLKSYTSKSLNESSSRSQKARSKALMGDLENVEYEVEIYTPDKENFTPKTRLQKSMKRMGLFDINKMSSSVSEKPYSVKVSSSPYLMEQNYQSTEKENGSLFFGQEVAWPNFQNETGNKKTSVCIQRTAERVPLQSLSMNSSCTSKPDASVNKNVTRSQGSDTRAQFQRKISPIKNKIELEAKVKWCMVVDSSCFLDSESRKALTLLQGLRGTRLIVPATVLRELDAMKQKANFFRQTTEVSAALKWLEDCFVNTKWWIHIQSSSEEARHLLPTPPASPKLMDGKKSWKTFSILQSLSGVSSPRTEDCILDYAFRQMRNIDGNQRIAILSNDTSLRIKAKAQGLICETATEFRDSLVNPFSERFLWSESAPRGCTWSCQDDIVLREHFYSPHLTNPSKGHDTVKGLKLILAYGTAF